MPSRAGSLVSLRSAEEIRRRRPLLVAHRGAVGPGVPENTLASLRAAVAAGYDLVEIDVSATLDGVPVLFHPDRAGTMWVGCGVDAPVESLTSDAIAAVRYRASVEGIPTLDEALSMCAASALGVSRSFSISKPGSGSVTRMRSSLARANGAASLPSPSSDSSLQAEALRTLLHVLGRAGSDVPPGGRSSLRMSMSARSFGRRGVPVCRW